MLRTFVHFLLLLGAVVSLSSQGVASAALPCVAMMQSETGAMAGMTDCCDHDTDSGGKGTSCPKMTAACTAMAGCAAPVGLGDQTAARVVTLADDSSSWQLIHALEGRSDPPDLHPPARFG